MVGLPGDDPSLRVEASVERDLVSRGTGGGHAEVDFEGEWEDPMFIWMPKYYQASTGPDGFKAETVPATPAPDLQYPVCYTHRVGPEKRKPGRPPKAK